MPKPLEVILEEVFTSLHSLEPRINTSRGTWTWQMAKVFASKYAELDIIMSSILAEMSISFASGYYLDSHGIEAGIFRSSATQAVVNMRIVGVANDTFVPVGTTFSTQKNIKYVTTRAEVIPNIIAIKKGAAGTYDNIPQPYSNVESILWINTTPTQTGTSYLETTDWTFANDQVDWSPGGAEPAEDTVYYIGMDPTETLAVDVPAKAIEFGESQMVSENQINVNTDGISGITEVYNPTPSVGGFDRESDTSFRKRLLSTSRVQFGYKRIETILQEIQAVRSARVFQITGVDVAYPNMDWQNDSWSSFETWNLYDSNDVILAQTWKPTGNKITLTGASLYVQKVDSIYTPPPSLIVKCYVWITDYATTVAVGPISEGIFSAEDVDPDHPDDWQEIVVLQRFGGLDYTKTYMFTVETENANSTVNSHWKIKYQNTGDEYADGQMFADGSLVNGGVADMALKTRWGGAGFTAIITMQTGSSFSDYLNTMYSKIMDFKRRAFIPICIEPTIVEADAVNVNITGTMFISQDADWNSVVLLARQGLENYLQLLSPGENVVFSRIERVLSTTPGVVKIKSVTIQRESDTPITNAQELDILIGTLEVAEIGTTTFTQGK